MQPVKRYRHEMWIVLVCVAMLAVLPVAGALGQDMTGAVVGGPVLSLNQRVSEEPLLAGQIRYAVTVGNRGAIPVTDKGYNLTISNTLPAGLTYVSAEPAPTAITPQATGGTVLLWDNVADLEVNEEFGFTVLATLTSTLTVADQISNTVVARVNQAPDNSGSWLQISNSLTARPQAIDLELSTLQSTADEQATGAGEYAAAPGRGPGADWAFQYRATVRNNNVGATQGVTARVTLPAGVAYLGNPIFSSNPNNVSTTPALKLNPDGSLALSWSLGNLTQAQFTTPIAITFNAAIPYRYRTVTDAAAKRGPFAGPMSGDIIVQDALLSAGYEATGVYNLAPTADGSESTPADDAPANVTAEFMALHKGATPAVVGIGVEVNYSLNYYVSEYYTVTNAILVDVLPDGATFVDGSASIAPRSVEVNTPAAGQTTITWDLPSADTTPGAAGGITFRARVDDVYEGSVLAGQPIVSGDALKNQVSNEGEWQDAVNVARLGTLTPDNSSATVRMRMPTFDKVVRDPITSAWVRSANAFVGDTLTFKLNFASAVDVDAKAIVIRDFLPRGMSYVDGSAQHIVAGNFSDGPGCASAPQTPTMGTLNGLQYLEWRLCNVGRGATWQATLQAKVGPIPTVQPGWIVANFGKLSGQNSYADAYSLRAMANTNYVSPRLVLDKTAAPSSNLKAGSIVNYTIKVTNAGGATAYNLLVQDTLPVSLTVTNAGGSATPTAATYAAVTGNPAGGQGGVLQWSPIASLAPGQIETFKYTATIPAGLPAGASLTNLASVSYNSRSDNQGNQVNWTAAIADDQTDDAIVYIKGFTIVKKALSNGATIGDTVRWVMTVTVPSGVKGFWPVVEENDLPPGFDYKPNTTVINGAILDTVNHAANPKDDGIMDLRWFFTSIDNSASVNDKNFTIQFDTLVTGVKGNAPTVVYYPNNWTTEPTTNTVRVGWYDKITGFNNTGYAWDGFETTKIDRRSAAAIYPVIIRQPNLSLVKAASQSLVGAGDVVSYTLLIKNKGNDIAHTFGVTDRLPTGMTLLGVDAIDIAYPPGFPDLSEPSRIHVTPATVPGATLAYSIDRMYVGATVRIVYRAQVAADIASDTVLTNTANIPFYYSKVATTPDTNGDGLPDLRAYVGPTATAVVRTPEGSIRKTVLADELTYGSTLIYTITVPSQPINATMYNVVVTDTIDSALRVLDWSIAAVNPNQITADLGTILPNEQRNVVITVQLPIDSTAKTGAKVTNRAWVKYGGGVKLSNEVVNTIVAPALLIEKEAAQVETKAGDLLDYTITVRNVGNGRAENLVLTDTLPDNMNVEPGTTILDSVAFEDPTGGAWGLPTLVGGGIHTLSFKARVNRADPGVLYTNTATVVGTDSRGQAIPADNSVRVPADTDADDTADAWVYGPLTWSQDSTYVAYEDLKNTGWSDWDYNDFIVKIDVEKGATAAGELAVLRLHYEAMAHGAAFDHQFLHKLPVFGNGRYSLKVYDGAGSLVSRAIGKTGDEPTIEIFKRTKIAMPLPTSAPYDLNQFPFSNTMQQQPGAVKGYQATLQVVLGQPGANTLDVLPPLPWDPYLNVYTTKQEVHLVQPGHLDNTQVVNNAFDPGNPMLGFDLPLANVFDSKWYWPQEFLGIWRVYSDYVNYSITDGFQATDWWSPTNPNAHLQYAWHASANAMDAMGVNWENRVSSRYYATPLVTDLENDGSAEIIVGNLVQWRLEIVGADGKPRQGWPQTLMGEVKAAAAASDLDGDGLLEILVGDMKGNLYAFHADGTPVAGWPIKAGGAAQTEFRVLSRPAVADINQDGAPEVIVALSDGKLYAYTKAGSLLAGWPVTLGDVADLYGSHQVDSSPVIADLDGDRMPEIMVGSYDKHLYAYHANGVLAWTLATGDAILGTPAVADIEPAIPGLETVIGSGDRFVYVVDKHGQLLWKRPTGWIIRSSPLIADVDKDGLLDIVIGSDDHKVYAWHHDGSRLANWPVATGAAVEAAPVLADVDGDGTGEIVVSSDDTNLYAWHSDGSLVGGWPQSLGSPAKGGPVTGNLDGDAATEVVVATSGGVLQPYGALWTPWGSAPIFLPVIGKR